METAYHRGYAIKRHGRLWRFQIRVSGEKRRPSFSSLEEAKAALDAILESREGLGDELRRWGDRVGPGHMSLASLCERWFRWKTGPESDEPIRARTRRDYRRCIDKYIVPLIGPLDAATVTTKDLKARFFRTCPSKTGARFSRTVLQQAFRWGIEEGLLSRRDNPLADLRLGRREAGDGRQRSVLSVRAVSDDEIPTAEEIQKMLAWCLESGRTLWWLWVYLTARLGLRPSETSALRSEDLDPVRRTVHIRRSAPDRSDPADWHLKTATSERSLVIEDPKFWEEVLPRLPSDGWVFEARARGGGRPQRTHTATPCWAPDAPNREFRTMRRALGLSERYKPYSLRHFVATRLILEGKDEIQVARFLGTSAEMVEQVYANHLQRDAQRDIGRAVMDLF